MTSTIAAPDVIIDACGLLAAASTLGDHAFTFDAGDGTPQGWTVTGMSATLHETTGVVLPATLADILADHPLVWDGFADTRYATALLFVEVVVRTADGRRERLDIELSHVGGAGWIARGCKAAPMNPQLTELNEAAHRMSVAAEFIPVGVAFTNVGIRLAWANERTGTILGRPVQDLCGLGWLDTATSEASRDDLADAAGTVLAERCEATVMFDVDRDGEPATVQAHFAPLRRDTDHGFVVTFEDITARLALEHQLAHAATHDALTGLPNRAALDSMIETLAGPRTNEIPPLVAVLFCDLDEFKVVNDSLGHAAGDLVLVEVARRLRCSVRDGDIVSRFGGDEFVIIARVASSQDAQLLGDRILAGIEGPFDVLGVGVQIRASVGFAIADAGGDVSCLLRDSDAALYSAKRSGKGRVASATSSTRAAATDRLRLEAALRAAFDTGTLGVAYQPIRRLDTLEIVGFEALARWTVDGVPIPASQLVALAEESGLMHRLGRYVLEQAATATATWHAVCPTRADAWVSVNASAVQLEGRQLQMDVAEVLAVTALPAGCLHIELTEDVLLADPDQFDPAIADLHALGIKVAIDDFGTGYSSLGYLQHIDADTVKLDGLLIDEIATSERSYGVCSAIVQLVKALGMRIVAERVETAGQLEVLAALGADMAQGWYTGRPMSAADAGELLAYEVANGPTVSR